MLGLQFECLVYNALGSRKNLIYYVAMFDKSKDIADIIYDIACAGVAAPAASIAFIRPRLTFGKTEGEPI